MSSNSSNNAVKLFALNIFGVLLKNSYLCTRDHTTETTMTKNIIRILASCYIVFLSSCGSDVDYSPLLTQADSAFIQGDYKAADSLLAQYDKSPRTDKKPERMYREMLHLTKAYIDNHLDVTDISVVDSLSRFYEDFGTLDKRVKSLLFLATVYKASGDYPSALNYFLQAKKLAFECNNTVLQCWANQDIGDLYLDQKMFDECREYYRQFYQIAESRRDTLRMAHASQRMGLVCTINNEIDSIAYYYNKAMSYGRRFPSACNTVEKSRHNLCDIYIQIEEYDKALALMSRDEEDLPNWAYWHWGQNHVDSAAYYFQILLRTNPSKRLYTKAEYLRILVQIEEQRDNINKALAYYDDLITIEDSIKTLSQTEETKKVKAQYNFNSIKQERDSIAERQRVLLLTMLLAGFVLLLCILLAWNLLKSYRHKKERQLMYERILRQRKDSQYRQSQAQLQDNILKLNKLTQQLAVARQQNDAEKAKRLELETEILVVRNKDIETSLRRKEYIKDDFESSELYMHLKMPDETNDYHMSDAEWKQLGNYIDELYDHFTSRLLSLANISQTEIRICYLVKMNLTPARIASFLCLTISAISKVRSRLYQKLTGQKGSSSQFDELIRNF